MDSDTPAISRKGVERKLLCCVMDDNLPWAGRERDRELIIIHLEIEKLAFALKSHKVRTKFRTRTLKPKPVVPVQGTWGGSS